MERLSSVEYRAHLKSKFSASEERDQLISRAFLKGFKCDDQDAENGISSGLHHFDLDSARGEIYLHILIWIRKGGHREATYFIDHNLLAVLWM